MSARFEVTVCAKTGKGLGKQRNNKADQVWCKRVDEKERLRLQKPKSEFVEDGEIEDEVKDEAEGEEDGKRSLSLIWIVVK
jgi:hypothetical protein